MTDITPLIPRQSVPQLAVPLVGGGQFDITPKSPNVSSSLYFIVACTAPSAGRIWVTWKPSYLISPNGA